MTKLSLCLFGGFRLEADPGQPIQLVTRKARALLAYLAHHPRAAQPRAKLAMLLWADSDDTTARNSLRQTLSLVRKAIAPVSEAVLVADAENITFHPDAIEVDTAEFERLAAALAPAALEEAAARYQGVFLEGFDSPSPEFEGWLTTERERFHEKALTVLTTLLQHHLTTGATGRGIAVATRLLSLDPLREDVHRMLMELYCRQGRRPAALRQYQICAEALARELEIEPDAATKALHRQIHAHRRQSQQVSTASYGSKNANDRGNGESALPSLSVVVLPFANLSNELDQEYFADGITEDLTTDLSRISGSFVIARNTAFTYKGNAIDVKRIGHELGVRYVVGGSVRRIGESVRINAQLVDASTGAYLWAHRFDQQMSELPGCEDEVTNRIAGVLDFELVNAESRRSYLEHPTTPSALDLTMRGRAMLNRPEGPQELLAARELFKQAVAIDSGMAYAWAGLAKTYSRSFIGRWSATPVDDVRQADEAICRALSLDPNSAWAHYVRGEVLQVQRRHEEALAEQYMAIELNHNLADAHARTGFYKVQLGHHEEAVRPIQRALHLSPRDPFMWSWLYLMGTIHFVMGRDEEAIAWLKKSNIQFSQTHAYLIAAYALAGHDAEAQAALAEFRRRFPDYCVERFRAEGYSENAGYIARRERLLQGLRKAGMPEQ